MDMVLLLKKVAYNSWPKASSRTLGTARKASSFDVTKTAIVAVSMFPAPMLVRHMRAGDEIYVPIYGQMEEVKHLNSR